MFATTRMQDENPGALFFDKSDMFQNITLPLWLARMLRLQPVQFSKLRIQTQLCIMHRTPLPPDKSRPLLCQ